MSKVSFQPLRAFTTCTPHFPLSATDRVKQPRRVQPSEGVGALCSRLPPHSHTQVPSSNPAISCIGKLDSPLFHGEVPHPHKRNYFQACPSTLSDFGHTFCPGQWNVLWPTVQGPEIFCWPELLFFGPSCTDLCGSASTCMYVSVEAEVIPKPERLRALLSVRI
ncbi:Hypothetical predicted protein [Podarcis lilfordi]|uniref:Uncharacterized protein n=1 Tax=Podarcis lilfordi TaxID=74358 RepID=A0AA35PR02_9SAUR|nr:Hypothetical predicted protein [Podarcis lilfordi]